MKSRFFCMVLILIIFLFADSGCQEKAKGGPAQGESKEIKLTIPVEVVKAARKPLEEKLEIVGCFEALAEVSLAPEVNGRVQQIPVNLGDVLKKGQVVLRLDPTDIQLQIGLDRANLLQELARLGLKHPGEKLRNSSDAPAVKKAKAVMENAYSNYKRNLRMRQEDLISSKDVEDALKDYRTAKADYESALEQVSEIEASVDSKIAALKIDEQKMQYCVLTAPMDGYVKEKKVEVGNYMQANSTAITLVDINPLYLSVDIPQNRIEKIKTGKEIVITTDAVPGKEFHGKIVQISPVVNPDTRTITVRAMIKNPEYILKPGMFSKVSLITGVDDSAIMVPKAALLEEVGVSKLFIIRKDQGLSKAYEVKVKKGEGQGDFIQVIGEVRDGDLVAVTSLAVLVEGIEVKIQEPDKSQTPGSPGK